MELSLIRSLMDKEFYGEKLKKYHNSWLFSPITWNELFWRYFPEEKINKYGHKENFLSIFGNCEERFSKMSSKISSSPIISDQIMWALTNQVAFSNKDKDLVSVSIEKFTKSYIEKNNDYEEHITERFLEIAKDIKELKPLVDISKEGE